MGKYELMVIVESKLADEEKEAIRKEATEIVSKGGGKVINSHVWLDKHKFTFQIKKRSEGTYYLINFESETSAVNKIQAGLKLNEKILRFANIKTE